MKRKASLSASAVCCGQLLPFIPRAGSITSAPPPPPLSQENWNLFRREAPIFFHFQEHCRHRASFTAHVRSLLLKQQSGPAMVQIRLQENVERMTVPFSILLSQVNPVALQSTIHRPHPSKIGLHPFTALGLNPKSEPVSLLPHPRSLSRARQRACARLPVVHLRGESAGGGGLGPKGESQESSGAPKEIPPVLAPSLTAPLPVWRPGRRASFPCRRGGFGAGVLRFQTSRALVPAAGS